MGKILALDYGKQRIGVAITDQEQSVAFPRETISKDHLNRIKTLIQDEKIVLLIVGIPLSLSGEETAQTTETREFIEKLRDFDVPIELIDERWTTIQATLSGGDDAVAAQIILKTYLDKKDKKA